jgi:hypothetical protein
MLFSLLNTKHLSRLIHQLSSFGWLELSATIQLHCISFISKPKCIEGASLLLRASNHSKRSLGQINIKNFTLFYVMLSLLSHYYQKIDGSRKNIRPNHGAYSGQLLQPNAQSQPGTLRHLPP